MKASHFIAILAVALSCNFSVHRAAGDIVAFGSGGNQFNIEFVAIGNPGNAADTTGLPNPAGSVAYNFNMGKFEVSRDMVDKANTLGGLGISLADMTNYGGSGVNRPATGVSWNEAARFVNWLNTSTGNQPAYKFTFQPGDGGYSANADIVPWVSGDTGYDPNNVYRNSQARYVLPSVNEWYKAAYYNPATGTYSDYPTGSDTAPTPVASGTAPGTAVYGNQAGPADITLAGGLSFYGTMGQGGNAIELEETDADLVNDTGSSARGARGGSFSSSASSLLASNRGSRGPATDNSSVIFGFRVASLPASVPEPSAFLFGSILTIGFLLRKKLVC